ncbi:hypothetical protein QBC45DRAFT_397811 [Copromyces sp. CBS 386.78]|nr:hypothetical protein QBC45DRAFT_397811 [Copromyces sp. CBS 386.78]
MPSWALDAKIELTGSQLLHLDQTTQVYEEWEGFSDPDGDSDSHSSKSSHDPSHQPACKSANPGYNSVDDYPSGPGDAILNPPSGAIPPSTAIEDLQASVNKWAVDHGICSDPWARPWLQA